MLLSDKIQMWKAPTDNSNEDRAKEFDFKIVRLKNADRYVESVCMEVEQFFARWLGEGFLTSIDKRRMRCKDSR